MRQHPHTTRARAGATRAGQASPPECVVFATPGCAYCRRAKEALQQLHVPYQEVDVSGSRELRAALREVTGQQTVPQVFVRGSLLGGSDSLQASISDGSFARLLEAAPGSQAQPLPAQLQQALDRALQQQSAAAAAAAEGGGSLGQGTAGNPALQLPPDLQAVLAAVSDASNGVPRQPQQPGSLLSQAFTGQALVDWLVQHNNSSSGSGSGGSSSGSSDGARAAAVRMAEQLFRANAVTLVAAQQPSPQDLTFTDSPSRHYRLRSDAPRELSWGAALNAAYWWGPAPARPAGLVAEELRGRMLALYERHLARGGKGVDYEALKQDPAFWQYVNAAAELQRVDLSPLPRAELMSFAINLYNALCIHALVVHGPQRYNSFFGRMEFFQKASRYVIGGSEYVLDDLENGILRGNQPGAASLGMLLHLPWLSKGPFREGDPRAQHVVAPVDPRIHFALVCGAASCPPIKLYTPATLEEGLGAAAEAFCEAEVAVDVGANKVTLSKIFSWYYVDFGADKAARLRFLLPHLSATKRAKLQQLLSADPSARSIRLEYRPYDWTINAA